MKSREAGIAAGDNEVLGPDPWLAIPRSEFVERQTQARALAQDAGVDGLVVYSRGSNAVNMYANTLYLTNHYSQHPYVHDHSGIGRARGHGVVILPVNGPSRLIVDIPWWRSDLVVADDVRVYDDVTEGTAETLRDAGLKGKRLGLVGSSSMSASAYIGLLDSAQHTKFVILDKLLEKLRVRKSAAEQAIIRRAAKIGNRGLEAYVDALVAGGTEAGATKAALDVLVPAGAILDDAIASSGPFSHHFGWARLPSYDPARKFLHGDMVHVDFYGAYGGYFWDLGRTRVVGDDPARQQHALLEATVTTVEHICETFKPGITAGEAYQSGAQWLSQFDGLKHLPDPKAIIRAFPLIGHGLGMGWETPWLTTAAEELVLEPGMYLSSELYLGHPEVGGVMFEQNGLVTEDGFEVLSACPKRWW
jgi:Xaa-Pro dipeptidase